MATDLGQGRRGRALGWLPWMLLAVAWLATAPLRPLLDPDEGRYAEIPREMVVSGDWVTPRFDDLKYFEKPPLQYWATAAAYSVFGQHQWTSRLWSYVLAFACLPLICAWVVEFYGSQAALAAFTALAVSPLFAIIGHLNLLDAGFTFWLTAMVLAFTRAQCAPLHSSGERGWMLIAWVAAALAVLSKGIVVGVLAGLALLAYTLSERDRLTWRRLHLLAGVPLFLVIAAPWFILVSVRNPSFPGFFFVHEHFARFLTTVHQRVEPWWFFCPLLLLGVLPWLVPLLHSVARVWRDPLPAAGASGTFRPLKFLLVYAVVTLLFFSASGSKLAPYILPMLPVLAAITGAAGSDPEALARQAARAGGALMLVMAGGLLIYSAVHSNYVPRGAYGWALGAALVALAALVMSFTARRIPAVTQVLVTAAAAVLGWQFLLCEYTLIPPSRSARELVSTARAFIGPNTPLYSVGQYRETVSPYLGRTLQLVAYEGELQFGQDEEPGRRMDMQQFVVRWSAGGEAVAFFDPGVWDTWRRQGLPGRVIAADSYTIAVSRL